MKLLLESLSPENPTVAVRWCLSKAEQEALLQVKFQVFVLIVTAYENGAEDRSLCKVEEAMTHLVFRFSGKHKVFSRLIWRASDESDVKLKSILLQRQDARTFHTNVLNYEGDGFNSYISHVVNDDSLWLKPAETIEVEVDEGHFAKEPPRWLKEWVNDGYSVPPRDQCEFRKRAMWAFTGKPLWLLVIMSLYILLATVSLTVGVLLLARGLHPKSVIPGWGGGGWVWREVEINYQRRLSLWSWEDEKGRPAPWRILLTPLLIVIVAYVLEYLHARTGMGYLDLVATFFVGIFKLVLAVIVANLNFLIISFSLVALAFFVLFLLVQKEEKEKMRKNAIENSPELKAELARQAQENRQKALEEAYAYLTCSAEVKPSLAALPAKRRTLRLRFQDLKRDVCRPYAR